MGTIRINEGEFDKLIQHFSTFDPTRKSFRDVGVEATINLSITDTEPRNGQVVSCVPSVKSAIANGPKTVANLRVKPRLATNKTGTRKPFRKIYSPRIIATL